MLLRAVLVTLLSVVGISSVVHFAIIQPQARQELDNAAGLAIQELKLRLESKQDSAISMAAALARDERVRKALLTGDREFAVSAVKNIREDYASTTPYQSISAQVIDANRIIRARSWDLTFFGEKAPHPLWFWQCGHRHHRLCSGASQPANHWSGVHHPGRALGRE